MNLLAAKLYDPTTAATFGTAASAMAVFDTTNLRITFTVPASGYVRVVIKVTIHGATTYSQILLGVMNGAAVTAKVLPEAAQNGTALATTMLAARADFVVPGLSPGASLTWDAAWGIETFVASSLIKYGGPANATANNDFGAAQFEIWDPQPLPTVAPGVANGLQICGANAATTYATLTSTGAFTVNGVSAVSQTGDSFAIVKSGGTGDNAAIKAKTDNLPASPASTTNITAASGVSLAASQHVIVDSGTVTTLTNLPAITAGWLTATGIAASALNGKGDWNIGKTGYSLTQTFPSNFASLAISAGGLASGDIKSVNAIAVTGSGTAASPWGPA